MTDITIRLPQNQPALEAAIKEFLQAEFTFQQPLEFTHEASSDEPHKGTKENIMWALLAINTVMGVTSNFEGVLQFSDRVKRLQRVEKVQQESKQAGCPVYITINNITINLSTASSEEVMNLLAEKD